MSEFPACKQLSDWLLEEEPAELAPQWAEHINRCPGCQQQWRAHQSLVVAFADEEVPEISAGFEAALEGKLRSAKVEVRPLSGWRRVAMVAYGAVALGIVGWKLRNVPIPAIDLSSSWVLVAAFVAIPLTLMLAVTASRWLPAYSPKSRIQVFAL